MQVTVQGTRQRCDSQVDGKDLEHARNDTTILASNPAKKEPADSSHLFRHHGHDVRHSSPVFLEKKARRNGLLRIEATEDESVLPCGGLVLRAEVGGIADPGRQVLDRGHGKHEVRSLEQEVA
jgi:hypothetical protein